MTDHNEVCTVITAIMGKEATVGVDYGNWNGTRYVGFAAEVEDRNKKAFRVVPGKTALDAACELLASVRKDYPERASLVCRMNKCIRGMEIYGDWVSAKTDALMAESAARLADIRSLSAPVAHDLVAAE